MSAASLFQTFTDPADRAAGGPRLARLRAELASRGLDGFWLPRADEQQNEYLPACEERLAWLTGFTGSAGACVVLKDRAAVFSDGRYTVQLAQQIDPAHFSAETLHGPDSPVEWLVRHAPAGATIGFDPRRHTPDQVDRARAMAAAAGLKLIPSEPNPVDAIWADRPAPPMAPAVLHALEHAGEAGTDKLARVQAKLTEQRLHALLVTDCTSTAWLFNIRGGDVPHKPMPIAAALVPREGRPTLFIDGRKLSNSVRAALAEMAGIAEPSAIKGALEALGAAKARVRLDRASVNVALVDALKAAGGVPDIGTDPITAMKAVKNAAEIAGAKAAQLRDGAAMVEFLAWFDREAPNGQLTEIDVAVTLEGFRRATGALKDISFGSIAAAGPNAALPHYRVTSASNRPVTQGLFLIDSGGQYLDGTTDITRTLAVGRVTRTMQDRFTRVLKGHIAIATAVFPKGTTGVQIDMLARQALWQIGADFDHGTGHGVGSYLGVHEGPQSISKRGQAVIEAGMLISNEPGYYRAGAFGIRTENLVLTVPAAIADAEREMLAFETITLCPIDRRLILKGLLGAGERRWLDAYHARVREALMPLVKAETRAWLAAATAPL
jgi:Xaa-Pro aminopeptidase